MRTKTFLGLGLTVAMVLIQAACGTKDRTQNAASSPAPADTAGNTAASTRSPAAITPEVTKPKPLVIPITLPAGTRFVVRTTNAMSSKTQAAGQSFSAYLEQPVVRAGQQIVDKGAEIEGVIVSTDRGGRVKGRASLSVQLTSFHTAGGATVKIVTNTLGYSARATKGKDAAKIGIGAGIGAALGAIFGGGKGAAIGAAAGGGGGTGLVLATRGAAAVIPSETVLSFALKVPVTFVN